MGAMETSTTTSPVSLTDSAISKLAALMADEAEPQALRIAVTGGGCSGFQYALGFDTEQHDDDLLFEHSGVRVVVDETSAEHLQGAGKFLFTSNALWASVRAGTLVILRNNATAADIAVGGSDYKLDIGLANATYFSNGGGALDIAGTELVLVKAAGTGVAGAVVDW